MTTREMNWLQVFLLSKIVYKKNSESLEYSAPPDLFAFNLNNLIVRTNPDTERLKKQIFSKCGTYFLIGGKLA